MTHINDTHELIKVACKRLDTPHCEIVPKYFAEGDSKNEWCVRAWETSHMMVTEEGYGNEEITLIDEGKSGIKINYEVYDSRNRWWESTCEVVDDPELVSKFHEVRNRLWDEKVERENEVQRRFMERIGR